MNGAQLSGASFIVICTAVLWLFTATVPSAAAIRVSSVAELVAAVSNANSGGDKEIIISDSGSPYLLNGVFFRITADGVTIAGATGERGDVVLDGHYVTQEIFQISGSNVTVRDLTLKRAVWHPVHVFPVDKNVVDTHIENVHIIDPGQQAIKINQDSGKTFSVNSGKVKGSKIELTASGRTKVWQINGSCYTGGVDAHHAAGWNISDNVISGFWCEDGLSEHGVHFWSFSRDTVVERNWIINCDRGIGFGLGSSGHIGGIVRNNMIYHNSGHGYSDVGIGLESAAGAQVYNNTVFHDHSYANAIEYRFAATTGTRISNNLTNRKITSRQGGSAELSHNVTNALPSWFVDAAHADLHLAYSVNGVADSGAAISGLQYDFDREKRSGGGRVDIGADERLNSSGSGETGTVAPWLQLLMD